MTDIAESTTAGGNASPLEGAEERRADVEDLLARARATVARTREVIEATRASLGPPPSNEGTAAE